MKLFVDTSKLDEPKSGSNEENRLTNCTRKDAGWWELGQMWTGGKGDRGMGVRSPGSKLDPCPDLM